MTTTATVRFDPTRLATLRDACAREWERERAAEPETFRTRSGTIATGESIARQMFAAIEAKQDCMAVCFLQSKAIGRAVRSLGIKFTIKACNAWLRGD